MPPPSAQRTWRSTRIREFTPNRKRGRHHTETTVKNTGSRVSSPRRGASPRELVLGGVAPACHPSGGSVSGPRPGGLGPAPSNADLAPTLSERSPLSPGRRPGRLGRTMRGETSQAGNRARKTRRRSRRGEHAGELEGGPPEASGPWDRHAPAFGSPGSAGAGVRAPGSSLLEFPLALGHCTNTGSLVRLVCLSSLLSVLPTWKRTTCIRIGPVPASISRPVTWAVAMRLPPRSRYLSPLVCPSCDLSLSFTRWVLS